MRKVVLTFGLIAGAILSIMMIASTALIDTIGFDKGEIIGYTTMVIAFLMIFFGVKAYRDNVAGGELSFGRAFKVGMLIFAIASTCYVATWQVIYYAVWPDFPDKYAAHTIDKARAGGATEAELAVRQREMTQFAALYKNPLINIALTFLEPLPVGLGVALIAAGVLRRRKNGAAVSGRE